MVRNTAGGPRSKAGTPLVRVDRGHYVLADDSGVAKDMRQVRPQPGVRREDGPMSADGIFISYRREDAGYPAGWLFGELAERFGAVRVFKDVDSIDPGDDFAEMIAAAVSSCAALLAVIGPRWLTAADEDGQRRLDDAADLVRLEIEAALTRGVRVIPVLVDSARMPRREQLPASLGKLATRQAVELSPARFRADLGPLISVLDKTLARQLAALTQQPTSSLQPAAASAHDALEAAIERLESSGTSANVREATDGLRAMGYTLRLPKTSVPGKRPENYLRIMDPMSTAHGVGYLTPSMFSFSRASDRERLAVLPGATMTSSAVSFSHIDSAQPGLEAGRLLTEGAGNLAGDPKQPSSSARSGSRMTSALFTHCQRCGYPFGAAIQQKFCAVPQACDRRLREPGYRVPKGRTQDLSIRDATIAGHPELAAQ
jgi:hypothetical protein